MYIPGELIPITLFVMAGLTAIGVPIARAYARRIDREAGQPKVQPEVAARLERMEQALDAIAIEVERISEGQRFTTRLLSERGAERAPERGQPTRVPELTSPHPGGRHAQ